VALIPNARVSACERPAQVVDHSRWVVTAEGRGYADGGTPEARVWQAAGASGVPLAQLKVRGHLRETASRTAPDWCFADRAG